ncbi:MAG: hypothetical protein WEE67_03350 [Chloroflexota bacterium]
MLQSAELDEGIKDSRRRLGLRRKYNLGILLVHGIGEQMRGDTLTEEGDYIFRWLRRRVESPGGPGGAGVDVLDVALRQVSSDGIPTAHAVVRITPPTGTGAPAHWIVAESSWADVFRPATYAELAGWAVTVGPWVFATQVAGIVNRMEIGESVPRLLRLALIPVTLLAGTVMLLGAAIMGLVVTALALALVLLAITRLPFMADLARSLQRGLANGFGDAYVLTRSPIRFGAMATQVRSDLQVLLRECATVAVVAHSQGTAVSWYALKHELTDRPAAPKEGSPKPAPIGLFVTYGQAVRKLTFVLTMARGSQTAVQTLSAIGSAAFLVVAGLTFLAAAPWPLIAVPVLLAVIAEFALLNSARRIWTESGEDIESDWAKVVAVEPGLEWLDLWASADPAPVGPLDVAGKQIRSYKIRNLASTIWDHVVYWRNTTEFVAIVASRLFALGGPKAYAAPLTDPRLQVAAMRRHARVLLLLTMRVFVGGAVVAGWVYAWLTPAFGSGLIEFVSALNLPLVDAFFDAPPEWVVVLAGFIGVAVLGVLAWLPVSLGWNALMGADETTYFRGIRRPLWTLPWYALGALVVLITGAAFAVVWLAHGPMLATAYVLGSGFLAMLSLAVLSSGGSTFAGTEDSQSTLVATRKITGRTSSGVTVAVVGALVLVLVPVAAALLVPAAIGWILAAETVVLSAVLAAEGVREYRLFRVAFNSRNAKLPESEAQP